MTINENVKNYVGIDVGKKTLVAAKITSDKTKMFTGKTDQHGISRLLNWLDYDDVIGLETGSLSFVLAKTIMKKCPNVIILNASDLAIIYRSLKKTDKEDSLKIARLIKRIPKNELPVVQVPDEHEDTARNLSSERLYQSQLKTSLVNRLHSVFVKAGITTITKKDLKKQDSRLDVLKILPEKLLSSAKRLERQITIQDEIIEELNAEIVSALNSQKELTKVLMSMPGIGIINAITILGYIGKGNRFSHPRQVSYYSGLVPRVDMSGETNKYGSITKRGCKQLRSSIVQAAWALVRSKNAGPLGAKYLNLVSRKRKNVAIVAIARKMLEALYVMLRDNKQYKYMDEELLKKKLASSGIVTG